MSTERPGGCEDGKNSWQSLDNLIKVVREGGELLRAQAEYVSTLTQLLPAGPPRAGRTDPLVPPEGKMPPNEEAEWVSPTAQQILAVMNDDYQPARVIAFRLGWTQRDTDQPPQKLYILLDEYVERRIIEQAPKRGYRLFQQPAPASNNP
jgi:hypothetical protein